MSNDRRGFLRNVAGAAATVAGVEALRGGIALAPTVQAAAPRPNSAGHFQLELDRAPAGFLTSAEGGTATADVIEQAPGESCLTQKNLGPPRYDNIDISFGTGMSAAFYEWMQAVFQCESTRRSGAIISADFNYKEFARRNFADALITEIGFPKLDASSKDPATLTVSLAPESTTRQKGSGKVIKPCAPGGGSAQKKWLASNFRFSVDGLDCKKVNKIDAFVIKQGVAERLVPGRVEFPNLAVTLPESDAESFYEWHEDFVVNGNNGSESEKKGLLEYLTPNLAQVLFSVELQNLGIFRLTPDKLEAGSEQIRRVTAEMYCEAMTFKFSTIAVGC